MSDDECDLFREYVERECGIAIGEEKKYLLEARLARLVVETGSSSYAEFYRTVTSGHDRGLRDQIVEATTTNETLWFRDSHPWVALRDAVLPELALRHRTEERPIRIWSAGCSTGQEPYSLAMLVDDFCHRHPEAGVTPADFEIVGTDISNSALTLALAGRYDPVSMKRGMTDGWQTFRDQHFETRSAVSEVSSAIRRRVRFGRLNFQDDFAHLGRFDLVLLRYVLIYFSSPFRKSLLRRVTQSMLPRGLLLLGAAEALGSEFGRLSAERIGRSYFSRISPCLP